jgi:hypothetical protein
MRKIGVALWIIPIAFFVSVLIPDAGFARVNVNIGVNIPLPGFVFPAPPAVVLVPGSYVYAVPDADIDIVFYHGYWYRPHGNYWYRSASYNGPWRHMGHERIPAAIIGLPPDYRHVPPGHPHIPYGHLKNNWRDWERQKYWDTHEYRHEQWERRQDGRREHYREERREHRGEGGGKYHHRGGRD